MERAKANVREAAEYLTCKIRTLNGYRLRKFVNMCYNLIENGFGGNSDMSKVAILMGSDSDLGVMREAVRSSAAVWRCGFEVRVHLGRTARRRHARGFCRAARGRTASARIIAGGGQGRASGGRARGATRRCRSSACRSNPPRWTGWTRCCPRCRCRRASRWRRWPSTARTTRRCWRRRFWRMADDGAAPRSSKAMRQEMDAQEVAGKGRDAAGTDCDQRTKDV